MAYEIDLRKRSFSASPVPSSYPRTQTSPESTPDTKILPKPLSWTAYEYAARERQPIWFITTGGIAAALFLFAVISQSYFFAAFIIVAWFLLLFYATRAPRRHTFTIHTKGVTIDMKEHPFAEFVSFWIFEERQIPLISFETQKPLLPFLHVPIGEIDTKMIREALKHSLPEKEHKLSAADELMKALGF